MGPLIERINARLLKRFPWLTQNPSILALARAEAAYRQKTVPLNRGVLGFHRLIVVMEIFMVRLLLAMLFAPLLAGAFGWHSDTLRWTFTNILFFTVAGAFLLAALLPMSIIGASGRPAANSIVRERAANMWEMLLLTGVSSRQLVLGKWWATVIFTWRVFGYRALILRLVLLIGFVIFMENLGFPVDVKPDALHLALACFVVVANYHLSLALVSATGVLGSLLAGRMLSVAHLIANVNRTLFYILTEVPMTALLSLSGFIYIIGEEANRSLVLAGLMLPIDAPSLLTITLITPTAHHQNFLVTHLGAILMIFSVHIILIWGTLRLAQWVAWLQRVSVARQVRYNAEDDHRKLTPVKN